MKGSIYSRPILRPGVTQWSGYLPKWALPSVIDAILPSRITDHHGKGSPDNTLLSVSSRRFVLENYCVIYYWLLEFKQTKVQLSQLHLVSHEIPASESDISGHVIYTNIKSSQYKGNHSNRRHQKARLNRWSPSAWFCCNSMAMIWQAKQALQSVKYYPGGQKTDFIPLLSEILSQKCQRCVQYTRCHVMSLISHFQHNFLQIFHF